MWQRFWARYVEPILIALLTNPLAVKIGLLCYVAAKNERDALAMTVVLHKLGLGVISDILGEEVTTEQAAKKAMIRYSRHIRHLSVLRTSYPDIRLAVSIKLSQLALKFDKMFCRKLTRMIFWEAVVRGVRLEIDAEGPETTDDTMDVIKSLVRFGNNFRVAIPANQKKSIQCIHICLSRGVGVRIVRGAYTGDIGGADAIDANFLRLVAIAKEYAPWVDCAIGTHHTSRIKRAKGILPDCMVQMLWGIRMFLQEKAALWTYMPWVKDTDAGPFYIRRIREGVEPNVVVLFSLNFFESLLWRVLRAPKTFCSANEE